MSFGALISDEVAQEPTQEARERNEIWGMILGWLVSTISQGSCSRFHFIFGVFDGLGYFGAHIHSLPPMSSMGEEDFPTH